MAEIRCRKCGYSGNKETIPKKCPYCDSPGSVRRAESAQELIDEADDGQDI